MDECIHRTLNTLRPRQNGRLFADDVFKCIFLNENAWISLKISLRYVPKGLINNIPALVQLMAWRRPGDKPLSEPMMVSLPTHICVTRPQWVNVTVIISYPWSYPIQTNILVKQSQLNRLKNPYRWWHHRFQSDQLLLIQSVVLRANVICSA